MVKSQRKVYLREEVFQEIEATHGFRPTGRQYEKILERLREHFMTGPMEVQYVKVKGEWRVDFGPWAKTYDIGDLKRLGFDITARGKVDVDDIRADHIAQLNRMFPGAEQSDTWHHMHMARFQLIDAKIHNVFKPHVGLKKWLHERAVIWE